MNLTEQQSKQIEKQLSALKIYKSWMKEIILDNNVKLSLLINNGVFWSDIIEGAKVLANFLYKNQDLYENKVVLDMWCWPGTQGLVMIENWAKEVTFVDINPRAIENVKENVHIKNISNCNIYESDLFTTVPITKYDLIVFNHPFFPEDSENYTSKIWNDSLIKKSMLADVSLLETFLWESKKYLKDDGKIIMPYFLLAGPENNPNTYKEKYGFSIKEYETQIEEGIQEGNIIVYLLETDDHHL